MDKHERKSCPRCGAEFVCKTEDIALCLCQSVSLSAEQLDYIADRYSACLCARCLAELRAECNLHYFKRRLIRLLETL
jgi:hypothetical protein